MAKQKLLFVDHSFHKKTGSTQFAINILRGNFDVDILWDDSWQGAPGVSLDMINRYEYVFFCQVFLPLPKLKKVTAKILWAPMYDGAPLANIYWRSLSYLPIKVIAFSDVLYKKCMTFRIDVLRLRYYFPPDFYAISSEKKKLNFLFWYRGSITFDDIKKFLDPENVGNFIYRSSPDAFFKEEKISPEDIKKYNMKIIDDSAANSRGDYLRLLDSVDVFIAPRKKEGIGMSFLEAIAMGKVVIAYDGATMNEYIKNGYNGYLFKEKQSRIDFKNFPDVLENSRILATEGRKQWENDENKIVRFIMEPEANTIKKTTLVFWAGAVLENVKGKLSQIKNFHRK
jgi:hypothetical protein